MDFRDMTYSEAEAAYAALQAENETLRARVADLESRLGVPAAPALVELRRFSTLTELEEAGEDAWERIPEEEAMRADVNFAMRVKMGLFNERMRENGWHLPFRNVVCDELDCEVRRMGGTGWDAENLQGGLANPDVECIVALRALNLTNPIWMASVQPNDDKWEGDRADRERLIRDYAERVKAGEAGLRFATKTWEIYPQYSDFLRIFREVYGGDYDPENTKRQIPVTDV